MERKVVTVVFADLIGSTALHESLDPESVSRVMEDYHRSVRGPIESHGGTVVQLLGDGVMCAFGVPRVAEDDALRAVRAAVGVQSSFREFVREHSELAGRLGLRVAVNTGEVVVSDDYAAGIGDPLNVAARLQQEAKDGDVLLGEATERVVAERVALSRVGSFAIKGRGEPVTAYRVVSLERPTGTAATPFVGRDDEVHRLMAVYEAAVAAPAARLAVLLGSPGLGKSRLLDQIGRQLEGRATVLTAQCNPAGGATFAPLAEALRVHLQLEASVSHESLRAAIDSAVPGDDSERAGIASGIGGLLSGAPTSPEETFFAVRRLLSGLAAERPVVLAIDDLQWAEPLLLDFTEHLVQWGAGVPLLVLAAARPELRDTRSSFTTPGGLISDVVTLGGLDASAAMRLAANVIGAETLPATVAGRVLTTSEGNPLFLRELVRMLVNDGALRREGDRWTVAVDLAQLEMPPTIQALLAARIERLRPEERLVLERAAVVGRQFSRAAVTHLLPREAHADLDARIEALRRSELVEADTGWLLGEPALRFHHVLIRDAAYRRILRGTRAELHARFAEWLEARTGESAPHDEAIGWHLEQAHQHLREIGPLDAAGRALGERAARHLADAGRRALARDDLTPAGSQLGRALDCLGDDDPARAELALDWCESLLAAGDVNTAARAIAELGRFTAGSERLRAWHTCFTGQLAALADPKALRASAEAVAAAAATLAAVGDVAGESKAHSVHAGALVRLGMIGSCEAALDKALAAARRINDRRRANAVLAGVPLAVLWGPSPVTRASGRCLDVVRVLRITQGAPAVEAVALRCQAVLETLRGRSEAARRMIASSRRLVEELGITQRLLEADMFAGLIELLEGDAIASERWLRPAYEGFREHGLGVDAARAAALLARSLLAQGKPDEAEALSRESEALAGDDFKAAITWRGVRAEALAGRGEYADAIELARAAVEIAAATDDLLDHADARSALAVALRVAGRSSEADAEQARAIELWEQKGATLLAERARRAAGGARADRVADPRSEPPRPERRRVQANAATANVAHFDAAIAARAADALQTLIASDCEVLDHTTGSTWDRQGYLASWRLLLSARAPIYRNEPLATLGDALSLCRTSTQASGFAGRKFDVGAYEREEISLSEVDAHGLQRRAELFAADRLGDAVARLYQRYAELLHDGPGRLRAAATARSVATLLREPSDRWPYSPDAEATDHRTVGFGSLRGADAMVQAARALHELTLAQDRVNRVDDVLGVRSDALLVRWTNSGTDRASGGAFERDLCQLWLFGADGLLARWEQFDAAQSAEALARFDELTAEPPAARPVRRRLLANTATAYAARVDAAVAARDSDALPALIADDSELNDHTTGTTYDRREQLLASHTLLRARDPKSRHELLATLGDSLALFRWSRSASGFVRGELDVGAFENEPVSLVQVDAQGRQSRGELFALDHLVDAVARLYQRYAELLPDGPERMRAMAIARVIAVMPEPPDPDRWRAAFAPAIEFVDRRTLGVGSVHGAGAFLENIRPLQDLSDEYANRIDDIFAARPGALLVRWTNFGIQRAGGGAYERQYLLLLLFGADGLVTRVEMFDSERVDEALSRFDELTAEALAARPIRRRVRANAATAHVARLDAAIASRDADALPTLLSGSSDVIDHPTGAAFDRDGVLATWSSLLRARDPVLRHEPLATLGDSLALCRVLSSGSGFSGRSFDVGAYDRDGVGLIEVDANGRRRRSEGFAPDRLGDAVVRLYERHAELLPDGPERTRAAATVRSVAVGVGPYDIDRWPAAFAPAIEAVDHRTLGTWSARGAKALLEHFRSLLELADDAANRDDEVLGLRSDALLVRRTHFGTFRAGGGAYERQFLALSVFGRDGLITRIEWFDTDRDAEALARFDELTGEPPEERFENAASRGLRRLERCWNERDWEGVVAMFAPGYRISDRRSLIGLDLEGEEALASVRMSFDVESGRWSSELLATRGERLALFWRRFQAEGVGDIGAFDSGERLSLSETDAEGRRVLQIHFEPGDLDAAYAELDARYAAGEAAPHAHGWEALKRLSSPLVSEGWKELTHKMPAPDARLRLEHVLALDERGALCVARWIGSRETLFLGVMALGADGRVREFQTYDHEQLDLARARFAELRAGPPTPWVANAATRNFDRLQEAWAARDWERVTAEFAADYHSSDRRATVLLELDRDESLAFIHMAFDLTSSRQIYDVLATRGDRLALAQMRVEGAAARDAGPSEIEFLSLIEVNEKGERVAGVRFDPDDIDAAYAELDQRYVAGEAAPFVAVAAGGRAFVAAVAARAWNSLAKLLAPDLVVYDHRQLGWETLHGPAPLVDTWKSLVALAPDVRVRIDHAVMSRNGSLAVLTISGTHEGGAFEDTRIVVHEYDGNGKIRQHDIYALDQLDEARARFEAIAATARGAEPRPDPLRIPANAAVLASARHVELVRARDWAGLRALASDDLVFDDRTRFSRVRTGTEAWIEANRFTRQALVERELIGTAGDRVSLERVLWIGDPEEAPMELEFLKLLEVGADGRIRVIIRFDPDDRGAAFEEAQACFVAGEAAAIGGQAPLLAFSVAIRRRDWGALRGCLGPDAAFHDHRPLSFGELNGDQVVESLQVGVDLAPDLQSEMLCILAWNRQGRVEVNRRFGTLRDGGPFENLFLSVVLTEGDRVSRLEVFDIADAERALASFDELCADRP